MKPSDLALEALDQIEFSLSMFFVGEHAIKTEEHPNGDSQVTVENKFQFADFEDQPWLGLKIEANNDNTNSICIEISFLNVIPAAQTVETLKLLNHFNSRGSPCAFYLNNSNVVCISTYISFTGYHDIPEFGTDYSEAQFQSTFNIYASIFGVARACKSIWAISQPNTCALDVINNNY